MKRRGLTAPSALPLSGSLWRDERASHDGHAEARLGRRGEALRCLHGAREKNKRQLALTFFMPQESKQPLVDLMGRFSNPELISRLQTALSTA